MFPCCGPVVITLAAGMPKGKGKARDSRGGGGRAATGGVSATEEPLGDGVRPGDGAAGSGGATEVRVDSKGRRRKRLTFAMEEYRQASNVVRTPVVIVEDA